MIPSQALEKIEDHPTLDVTTVSNNHQSTSDVNRGSDSEHSSSQVTPRDKESIDDEEAFNDQAQLRGLP